jgi:hypothetical protein
MWTLSPQADFERRRKRYEKKRRRELVAVLGNLDRFFKALLAGTRPYHVKGGFVHYEPHGVIALTEQGGGGSLQATRLYTYPSESEEVLYLITLGDKQTQPADIKYCSQFVESLNNPQQQTLNYGSEKNIQQRGGDDSQDDG